MREAFYDTTFGKHDTSPGIKGGKLMLKPMFGHRPKPKKFDLPLRYYDPEKDKRGRQHRIKIERKYPRTGSNQGIKVVMYAAGLGMVVWFMSIL